VYVLQPLSLSPSLTGVPHLQIPGNDDSGAMAALLLFHILGMYPVPASKQLLIGSPLVSAFTLTNDFFGTTTSFVVDGFDAAGLAAAPANGSALFVNSVTINGKASESLCWIDWDDVVGGGKIVITVDADQAAAAARGCGAGPNALPDSLATGGF
jgi:putative alpha-1,2-mannosidase